MYMHAAKTDLDDTSVKTGENWVTVTALRTTFRVVINSRPAQIRQHKYFFANTWVDQKSI